MYNKLHIFKVYNLVVFDKSIYCMTTTTIKLFLLF